MALSPGDQVDRYLLEERLGRGGQGEVWRAQDPLVPGRLRAVKLVPISEASPAHLERVRREARQLVQLKHVSLVECFGLFEDLHRELLGIVMDLVDGQPLDELVDDSRLDSRLRALVLAHVASALAYVHQRDVVHRDVKLNNVLVTRSFWDAPEDPAGVKLIDFGIAAQHSNPSPLTQFGHVIGTPPYMAPELLEPEFWAGSRKPSAAADVFAFGILAWQLFARDAGAHPTGLPASARLDQYSIAYRKARDLRWPPNGPDARWRAFFENALALHPHMRLQNGFGLVDAIAAADPSLSLRTMVDGRPAGLVSQTLGTRPAEEDAPTVVQNPTFGQRSAAGSTDGYTAAPEPSAPTRSTIPGEPPLVFAPTTATTARKRISGSPMLLMGIVLAAGVGLVMAVGLGFWAFASSDAPAAPPTAVQRAPTVQPTIPVAPPVELEQDLPDEATPRRTRPSCSDCDRSGTVCEDGKCRLGPETKWRLRPWRLRRERLHAITWKWAYTLCLRPSGEAGWTCTNEVRNGLEETKDGRAYLAYWFPANTSGAIFTQDQLERTGIDIEVRHDNRVVASLSRHVHARPLVAEGTLFNGGLRYGFKQGYFEDVLFRFESAEE